MGHIEFYPDGDPRLGGADSVEHSVSYTTSVASGLRRYSSAMAMDAKATLAMAGHRIKDERSEIGTVHQGLPGMGENPYLDSTVYLAAPDESLPGKSRGNAWRAVQSIEFGHYTHNYGYRRNNKLGDHEGPIRRRRSDNRGSTWVPGVAPLQKAMKKALASRRLAIK